MVGYRLHRLAGTLGVVFAMSVLIFAVVHILPGNVAYAILGEFATPIAVAALEAKLGLNDPLPLQYWHWSSGMLHGDFGASLVMERPAAPVILEALGRSAILAGHQLRAGRNQAASRSAIRQPRIRADMSDRSLTLAQLLFIAMPDFFWAILAILLFGSWLHLLPATGYAPTRRRGVPRSGRRIWCLPVCVLPCGLIAHVSRLTRSSMLETLNSRYILAARAKGLPDHSCCGGTRCRMRCCRRSRSWRSMLAC